ncbi:hypothetical protein LTR28_006592, partial [Elasticomyces elasticus]
APTSAWKTIEDPAQTMTGWELTWHPRERSMAEELQHTVRVWSRTGGVGEEVVVVLRTRAGRC